jgi:ribosomal protein L34E
MVGAKPPLTYRGKDICDGCLLELFDITNNYYQGKTYKQETPYSHCKDCGKEFSGITSSYPSDDSEYCYMCYWRSIEKESEGWCSECSTDLNGVYHTHNAKRYCLDCYQALRQEQKKQERPICYGCGKPFAFAEKPNKFNSHEYCFACFSKLTQKRENPFNPFEDIHINYDTSNGSGTDEDAQRIFEEMFSGGRRSYDFSGFAYRMNNSSNSSTSYASSAVAEAFKILGLAPGATVTEIKKAFKTLALQKHPDLGGKHTDMVQLNKAKETALEYAGSKK